MPKCSILQCRSGAIKNHPKFSIHRLPRKEITRQKWLDNIGIGNINRQHKHLFVCSLHFEESNFNRTLDVVRLHDNAVPTIFNFDPKNSASSAATKRVSSIRKLAGGTSCTQIDGNLVKKSDETSTPIRTTIFKLSSTTPNLKKITESILSGTSSEPTEDPLDIKDELPDGEEASNINDDDNSHNYSDIEAEYLEEEFDEEVLELAQDVQAPLEVLDTATLDEGSETHSAANDYLQKKNTSVCATCFSRDRTLSPLTEKQNLMLNNICSDIQLSKEDGVCWECKEMLNKIIRFKMKALAVQVLFQNLEYDDKIARSLSNLQMTEIKHLSIPSSYSSLVENVEIEEGLDIPVEEEGRDIPEEEERRDIPEEEEGGDIETPPSPVTNQSDGESFEATKSTSPEKEIQSISKQKVPTDYKPRISYDVVHIPKLEDKLNLFTQPHLVKEVCKKKVLTEQEMEAFREKRRKLLKKPFRCNRCVLQLDTEQQLIKHNEKHDLKAGPYECRICEQRFPGNIFRDVHFEKHFIIFECAACDLQSKGQDAMLRHFEQTHREERRMCRDCGQVFRLFHEFRQHRLEAHGPKLTCEQCGKIFRIKSNFDRHVSEHKRQHTSSREYKCQICGQVFGWPQTLRKHWIDAHGVHETDNHCAPCNLEFKSLNRYMCHLRSLKHMKLANTTPDMLTSQCEDCGQCFAMEAFLTKHRKMYHGGEEDRCFCELCNKEFATRYLLKIHVKQSRRHKTERERNKTCEHCGKSFFTRQRLRQHMYTHSATRQFQCTCGQLFRGPHYLQRHCRRVHDIRRGWRKFLTQLEN